MITAAQLWYICTVYPEGVTEDECKEEFNKYVEEYDIQQGKHNNPHWRSEESIEFLWQSKANIINKLIHT